MYYYIDTQKYNVGSRKRECDMKIVILRTSKVAHICNNNITIYLSSTYFIESNNKYSPN